MVQRKVANKLGTKAESKNSIKSEKRSALKASQYQDIKGGSELKKKMKKVRSSKVSDFKNLGSPLKQEHMKFDEPTVHGPGSVSKQKTLLLAKILNGSPNYMKPTSSSDARKESSQVSIDSRIIDGKKLKFSKNSRHGSRDSQPKNLFGSGLKPKRVLTKSSSSKLVRCSMSPSYPKHNVNRATCSSTLKDYKFPASIVLNPDGNEYEGTSVVKVCPYTYCSLNGHHHAPLPPLKRFLSARRCLLRTQKKSKGLSTFMAKKEIDTGQIMETGDSSISEVDRVGLAMSTLIQEDFFLEIYTNSMAEPTKPKDYEKVEDSRKVAESELEEPASEISLEDNLLDQDHNFPVAEMDVPITSTDYSESGWVLEEWDSSDELSYKQADQSETGFEGCVRSYLNEDCESIAETQLEESIYEACDMDWEAQEASYPENKIDDYTYSDDGSDCTTVSLPGNQESVTEERNSCTAAPEEAEVLQDGCEENTGSFSGAICGNSESKEAESDTGEVSDMCNGQIQNQISEFLDLDETQVELDSPGLPDQRSTQETEENYMFGSTEIIVYSTIFSNSSDDASEKHVIREQNDENPETDALESGDNKGYLGEAICNFDVEGKIMMDEELVVNGAINIQVCDSLQDDLETDQSWVNPVIDREDTQKPDEKEDGCLLDGQVSDSLPNNSHTDQVTITSDQSPEHPSADSENKREMKEEDNNTHGLLEIQVCDSHQDQHKTNTEIDIKGGQEAFFDLNDMLLEENKQLDAAGTCLEANTKIPNEDGMIITSRTNCNQPPTKTRSNLREITNIKRKWMIENQSRDDKFNPRAPEFLPIKPDPEAEKVDLRHQMMDERKSAEEWMVDYALQQAVTKLAPARKRRVALLVEAFETIMPTSEWETHLKHSAASFTSARPIQACS